MAAGDATGYGPYNCDATGVATAAVALGGAYVTANDAWIQINTANGLQFFVIHIEGA